MTFDELSDLLAKRGTGEETWDDLMTWVEEGIAVAVYENHNLASTTVGTIRLRPITKTEPPSTIFPGDWRYRLIGTYEP
jgi:hypothetical protein